jgi:predicted adenine nucleotide alpha hydrolase (AANH) superfamily ATPase
MTAINIKAYTEDETQIDAIKAVLNAFKIKFEIGAEKPYDPKFVAKIKAGEKEFEQGDYKSIKTEDLWK